MKLKSVNREQFLIDAVIGKTVLHLGCADWPYTHEKIQNKSLLHDSLQSNAKEIVGFDISEEGVEAMDRAGYKSIVLGNAEQSLFDQLNRTFDVIIAGEIIEHVDNAGSFLESIKTVMDKRSRLCVTTPNYAAIKKVIRAPMREIVHPDHVYYFSPSTLRTLMGHFDYIIVEIAYYWITPRGLSKFVNGLFDRLPGARAWADGICVTAKIDASYDEQAGAD